MLSTRGVIILVLRDYRKTKQKISFDSVYLFLNKIEHKLFSKTHNVYSLNKL